MAHRGKHWALVTVAWAGWFAFAWSIVPIDAPWNDFDMGRFGIAVGPTCSVILALQHIKLPVMQVFEAGRQCGRRETSASPERPRLRVVDGD